jgi:hypothetical protein
MSLIARIITPSVVAKTKREKSVEKMKKKRKKPINHQTKVAKQRNSLAHRNFKKKKINI